MNKFIINSQDSLLLVIDIQEKLFKVMEDNIQGILKKNTEILMKTAKEFNIPVIITEQYKKGLGTTIPELANICSCPNWKRLFSTA
jgi:isochorismate hydrolase